MTSFTLGDLEFGMLFLILLCILCRAHLFCDNAVILVVRQRLQPQICIVIEREIEPHCYLFDAQFV